MRPVWCAVFSVITLLNITSVTSQWDSPWWPEQCEYTWHYKCGDICLTRDYRCNCGGEDWNYFDKREKKYCCVAPGTQCTTDREFEDVNLGFHNVTCSSGELLPWYQPCHHNNCDDSPVLIVENNCQFDCLARNDESQDKQNDTKINDQDYNLQNCTEGSGSPGLKYEDGDCKPNYKWCTEDISSCHSDLSPDKLQLQRLCQNSTLWESKDCNEERDI